MQTEVDMEMDLEPTEQEIAAQAEVMRKEIDEYLKQLTLEGLEKVKEFAATLLDEECEEATQELINIPGFVEAFEIAKKNIAEGKVIAWENVKRKY